MTQIMRNRVPISMTAPSLLQCFEEPNHDLQFRRTAGIA